MALWPTPMARDHRSFTGNEHDQRDNALQNLNVAAGHWPTPAARDHKGANGDAHLEAGTGRKHLDQLPNFVAHCWPTPTVDCEAGGAACIEQGNRGHSLHSATAAWPTPVVTDANAAARHTTTTGVMQPGTSLTDACRSFLPGLETSTPGAPSSPSTPSSPLLWRTPHGMANTDQYGKTGGGGGEFAKQATQWRTPNTTDVGTPPERLVTKEGRPAELGRRMYRTTKDGGLTTSKAGEVIPQSQTLGLQVSLLTGKPQLNPRFVEWLMGWPLGWTDSEPVATEWCRWQRRMRSALSRLVSGREAL